jgi:hypothetical protein
MPKIEFIPKYSNMSSVFPHPVPANKVLPNWWKSQTTYIDGSSEIKDGSMGLTVKKCQAIFDSMTLGYYLLAPVDLYIDATGDKINVQIPKEFTEDYYNIIAVHPKKQLESYPFRPHTHDSLIRFHPAWVIKTPPGYSCLFTRPMHANNGGMEAIPGVIDTDQYISDGFLSFTVEKGYKGMIKQGTPICQVTPFKREEWSHTIIDDDRYDVKLRTQILSLRSKFQNSYRTKFWSKKVYK